MPWLFLSIPELLVPPIHCCSAKKMCKSNQRWIHFHSEFIRGAQRPLRILRQRYAIPQREGATRLVLPWQSRHDSLLFHGAGELYPYCHIPDNRVRMRALLHLQFLPRWKEGPQKDVQVHLGLNQI